LCFLFTHQSPSKGLLNKQNPIPAHTTPLTLGHPAMPRPPPAKPPPSHSPRRQGAAPMPQPLFAGRNSRQHPDPRVPDHAATAPPESSGQPLPSSTREQIVSERWKKPQRHGGLKERWERRQWASVIPCFHIFALLGFLGFPEAQIVFFPVDNCLGFYCAGGARL
jgi:hypothetical protein